MDATRKQKMTKTVPGGYRRSPHAQRAILAPWPADLDLVTIDLATDVAFASTRSLASLFRRKTKRTASTKNKPSHSSSGLNQQQQHHHPKMRFSSAALTALAALHTAASFSIVSHQPLAYRSQASHRSPFPLASTTEDAATAETYEFTVRTCSHTTYLPTCMHHTLMHASRLPIL